MTYYFLETWDEARALEPEARKSKGNSLANMWHTKEEET